ncbi:MAG: YggT family protein [Burkholderiaceae bacterium]|nr:YggT family protein [Burkholderiaceae bacterium]MCD6671756.1 YggT family protein [Burkholderiaceae bacterium]
MHQALWLLLETLGSLLATACVLRAYLNWLGLGVRDPLGQFVIAVTDWIVRPLRGVLPATRRNMRSVDWASLLASLLLAVVLAVLYVLLFGGGRAPAFGVVVLLAIFWLAKWSLWLLTALVLLLAVLSWVNPHAPIAPTIDALTRPFLAPIRRFVPLIGGVDLSPLVLILLAQLALTVLQSVMPTFFAAVA